MKLPPSKHLGPLLFFSALTLAACSPDDSSSALTKEEAATQQGKNDIGEDLCELFGWYGDGVCDTFCPSPDPDCAPPADFCGGFGNLPCADGFACVDDPTDDCDPANGADCGGICVEDEQPMPCGGFAGLQCDPGFACVDDPSDSCELDTDPDCGGMCVEDEQPMPCNGFAGLQCDPGFACVDDPSDSCELDTDPDCGGICIPAEDDCPDPNDPEVHYVSEMASECTAILFACEPWQTLFTNECGCGCIGPEAPSFCGGFGGIQCEPGFTCVDDPSDDCELDDGADCGGMCVLD